MDGNSFNMLGRSRIGTNASGFWGPETAFPIKQMKAIWLVVGWTNDWVQSFYSG